MRTTWTFHTAQKIVFGRDAVLQLGDVTAELGAASALLVTDRSLAEAGLTERVRAPLDKAGVAVAVFDGGEPEPPTDAVEAAVAMAREARADVVIGLGGGSNIDLAKAAATVLAHGGSCADYAGDQVVPGPIFPLVCMPTTAGTGSEVTAAAILRDVAEGKKFGILSHYLRPRIALVDPLLAVTCPPRVTADSGIDALTHAIEAYTAVDNTDFPLPPGERTVYQGRHPLTDLLAERSIELVGRHLRRAVADGADIDAREGMALAAMLAGMSFSNCGVAAVHALEQPLAAAAHTTHGAGCGLLLPFVMRFNKPACRQRTARVAELLGEDITALDEDAAAERATLAVEALKSDIGIPARLNEVGVTADQLPDMAARAFTIKRVLRINPRPVTEADLNAILKSAL